MLRECIIMSVQYNAFSRNNAIRNKTPRLKGKSQTVKCLMINDAKSCRSNSYCEWDDETKCRGKEDLYATVNRGNNEDEELGGGRTRRRRAKRGGRKTKRSESKRSGLKRRHTKRSGSKRGRKTKRS
jgi:hypothetical protein